LHKENGHPKVIYTLDHWSGQTDSELYQGLKDDIQIEFVPEKTTSTCQPLDVYFNRQMKYLTRKIYNYAMVHGNYLGKSEKLTDRNSIIKIQSLVHFTLSAPVFRDMIRHSFFKAGYTAEKTLCLNVYTICFKVTRTSCNFEICNALPFIICSWCREEICFDHFLMDYHVMFCSKGPYC